MLLSEIKKGEMVEILEIGDKVASTKGIRIGLHSGARVFCIIKLPCGPVILRIGRQEVAIGRNLAQKIEVKSLK